MNHIQSNPATQVLPHDLQAERDLLAALMHGDAQTAMAIDQAAIEQASGVRIDDGISWGPDSVEDLAIRIRSAALLREAVLKEAVRDHQMGGA